MVPTGSLTTHQFSVLIGFCLTNARYHHGFSLWLQTKELQNVRKKTT